MHYLSPWCCWGLDGPIYQDWSPVVLNLFAKKKKKTFSCLFSDFRLIFVFIFLFHFIFFCSSWYLIEIKIYTNQFDQVCLLFLLTLLFLLDFLMLHIHTLLSFHLKHIFESIIFNIEDNVWFRFGGDVYRFISFCFVVLTKKKKSFA